MLCCFSKKFDVFFGLLAMNNSAFSAKTPTHFGVKTLKLAALRSLSEFCTTSSRWKMENFFVFRA
jgi:hypothetical protein